MAQAVKTVKSQKILSETKKTTGSEIPVFNVEGTQIETINAKEDIFNAEVNESLLAQYIRVYSANQRKGTASTKTRGEVTGSTRKIFRQKGTGRARHGSIKASIFVGGGIVGGPKPRDYSLKMNKKQKKQALVSALSWMYKQKNIIAINDDFEKINPKTKVMVSFLNKVGFDKNKVSIALAKMSKNNFYLATRNIANVELVSIDTLNPYMLLNSQKLILSKNAIELLHVHLK